MKGLQLRACGGKCVGCDCKLTAAASTAATAATAACCLLLLLLPAACCLLCRAGRPYELELVDLTVQPFIAHGAADAAPASRVVMCVSHFRQSRFSSSQKCFNVLKRLSLHRAKGRAGQLDQRVPGLLPPLRQDRDGRVLLHRVPCHRRL